MSKLLSRWFRELFHTLNQTTEFACHKVRKNSRLKQFLVWKRRLELDIRHTFPASQKTVLPASILHQNAYLSNFVKFSHVALLFFSRRATTAVRSFSRWGPRALPPRPHEAPRRQEALMTLHSAGLGQTSRVRLGWVRNDPLIKRKNCSQTHTQWDEEKKPLQTNLFYVKFKSKFCRQNNSHTHRF